VPSLNEAGDRETIPVTRRITGVMTSRGFCFDSDRCERRRPWAAGVAALAGADLPVEPLRRQLVPTEPFNKLPKRFPMVIDMSTGFHFRREGAGILLAGTTRRRRPASKQISIRALFEKILTHAAARVPCLADAEVNPRRAWAAYTK